MDLDELRLFLAVVQHGAFNAAADALHVPRSTLRRRVDALEARAGVPLLSRSAHGIQLTEAGKVLGDSGRSLLESASALLDSLRDVGKEPGGTLRIVLPVGPPPHVLADMFAAFRLAYPKLRIVSRCSEEPLREALTDTDVAFHFEQPPPSSPWLSEALDRMPVRLTASEAYIERHGLPREARDLSRHDLLVWHPPREPFDRLPLLAGGHVMIDPVVVTTDAHALRYAALRGSGLVYMPVLGIEDPLEPKRRLVSVLDNVIGGECVLRVSVPEALADIPKVRVVLEASRAYLKQQRLPESQ